MTAQQAIKPANGPFAPTFAEASAGMEAALAAVASYAAPIFWVVPAEDGQELHRNGRVRNGTLFVVDAGEGPFAVSANHVYEGYVEAKAKHPGTRCRVLPKPDGRRRAQTRANVLLQEVRGPPLCRRIRLRILRNGQSDRLDHTTILRETVLSFPSRLSLPIP